MTTGRINQGAANVEHAIARGNRRRFGCSSAVLSPYKVSPRARLGVYTHTTRGYRDVKLEESDERERVADEAAWSGVRLLLSSGARSCNNITSSVITSRTREAPEENSC